ANDLLLLVAHRTRHVHHVDDDGVGHRFGDGLPRPIALIVGDGDDDRAVTLEAAAGDHALQRFAVGALEVPERLRPDTPDARIAVVRARDLALALVCDVGQLELFAEDGCELVEGDVDLEDVIARFAACLTLARLLLVAAADRIARVAVALTDAAAL